MAVAKMKNGSWGYRGKYKDPKTGLFKDYYKSGFRTKRDAVSAERVFLEIATQKKSNLTLDEIFEIYVKDSPRMGIKKSTTVVTEKLFKLHISPYLGNKAISEITQKDCVEWQKAIIAENKYKPATINRYRADLLKVLNYAVKMEYIEKNPAIHLPVYKEADKIAEKFDNFWEYSEFKKFIDAAPDTIYRKLFIFLFWSGCRVGEALALNWEDIDFENKKIHINKTVANHLADDRNPVTGDYPITSPKTVHSMRYIDMQNILFDLLNSMYQHDSKIEGFKKSWYVFGSVHQLNHQNCRQIFISYIKLAGCKQITLHGLRHSHATWLIQKNIDDTLIAERLGHTVVMLRTTYAHIYKSQRDQLMNLLDNVDKL
jgi:integrase